MYKSYFKALLVQIGIVLALGLPAFFCLTNGLPLWGFVCIIFGPLLGAFLFQAKPWKTKEKKFEVLFFIVHGVGLMMILILITAPLSTAVMSKAYFNDLPQYEASSDLSALAMVDSGKVLEPYAVMNPELAFTFIQDPDQENITIGLAKVYEDDSRVFYAVFVRPNEDSAQFISAAQQAFDAHPNEVIILPNQSKRETLLKGVNPDKDIQFFEWRSSSEIISSYQANLLRKALISSAILFLIPWYVVKNQDKLN